MRSPSTHVPDRAQNVADVDGGYNSVTIAARRARPASPPPAWATFPKAAASAPRKQHWAAVDLNPEQLIRVAAQVAAAMKARLAMKLDEIARRIVDVEQVRTRHD
ncbi:hypothetical protein GUJ75_25900, partial|nr:hypothetical protein [Escherichia coli]